MRFAIVGDPVAHSRSPAIHNAAFSALGIDATFDFMQVDARNFHTVPEALRKGDLDGVSVTMPHKNAAFASVDSTSDVAGRTRAVNTIVVRDAELFGHNTDVAGVAYALSSAQVHGDHPVLILGAGGAAAAAIEATASAEMYLSARDASTAEALRDRSGHAIRIVPWGEAVPLATVINATPLGMHGESLPSGVLERAGALIDMVYGSDRSPAILSAISLGLPHADGLTMLVGQAIEAFELFTGEQAPLSTMETAARSL